jgi:hypothetical protein
MILIGTLAILGTQNERPRDLFYWNALTGQQPCILALEPGSTRSKLYCADLKKRSMTTHTIDRIFSLGSIGNFKTQVWANHGNRRVLQLIEMQGNEAPMTREIQRTEHGTWHSICVVDNHIILQRSGQIESVDFSSGSMTDSVPCPSTDSMGLVQEHITDTKSFLVSEFRQQGNGTEKEQILFKVTDGKLRQTTNWAELDHRTFQVASQSYILSLLVDGTTIEVRSAISGDVVSRYSVPQTPSLGSAMISIDQTGGKSWIHWIGDPLLYTDALTGKSLPVPVGSDLIERDFNGNRLITIRRNVKESSGWVCMIVDATTGDELSRFEIALGNYSPLSSILGGIYMIDSSQMVSATQDCRFFTYDISTGKLIQAFDPLLWADWCRRFALLAFGLWCLVWLRVRIKLHPNGWIDFAICTVLAVAFFCYQLQYNVEAPHSLLMLSGIFGSWVLAAMSWLVFGNTRWSLRFQPFILTIGITTGIMAVTTTKDQGVLAPFVVGLSMLLIALAVAMLPLRFLRFRFLNDLALEEDIGNLQQHRWSAFALRDVFSLTMAFALLFAVARLLPAADWSQARLWGQISMFAMAIGIPSLLAFWTAIGRGSWIARWGSCMGLIIGSEVLSMTMTKHTVPWLPILSAVVPTLFCFYAYRLRGWRLGR